VQHTVLLIDCPIHRQGVPGADYHNAEVPESSSKMSQDLQNEKSATSDVKSVLPKFSEINLLHNDLVCAIPSIYCISAYTYCCWRCTFMNHGTCWTTFSDQLIYCRACLMMISKRGLLLRSDLTYQGTLFDLS
jgi:hypothetical protein